MFLRVLDYYTGILFLTTNRAGALDEAFKSRIHHKIYYPPLSKDQALDIWRLNIRRLAQISAQANNRRSLDIDEHDILTFAAEQYDTAKRTKGGCWNGRQIRNAFQVARNLAHYDAQARSEEDITKFQNASLPPAILRVEYFRTMHVIAEDFESYMRTVHSGNTDGDLALEMEHRADHWTSDRWRTIHVPKDGEDMRHSQIRARSPYDTGPFRETERMEQVTSIRDSRPSYETDSYRETERRERSASMRGSRPSITGLGVFQRPPAGPPLESSLAPPASGAMYEAGSERGSPLPRQRPSEPRQDSREYIYEGEPTSPQANPFAPSRTMTNFGTPSARPFGPSGNPGNVYRDAREYDQDYQSQGNNWGRGGRMA